MMVVSRCFTKYPLIIKILCSHIHTKRITIQACNSEEDGLFGFDLHSDGGGQRF